MSYAITIEFRGERYWIQHVPGWGPCQGKGCENSVIHTRSESLRYEFSSMNQAQAAKNWLDARAAGVYSDIQIEAL